VNSLEPLPPMSLTDHRRRGAIIDPRRLAEAAILHCNTYADRDSDLIDGIDGSAALGV
jgi:hypothetical protein